PFFIVLGGMSTSIALDVAVIQAGGATPGEVVLGWDVASVEDLVICVLAGRLAADPEPLKVLVKEVTKGLVKGLVEAQVEVLVKVLVKVLVEALVDALVKWLTDALVDALVEWLADDLDSSLGRIMYEGHAACR
ncbi:hypothetical protein BGZ82_004390, partial [Podila clonocystis]